MIESVLAGLGEDKPTKAHIMKSIRAVARWKDLADIYGTKENKAKADEMLSELNRIMEGIGAKVPVAKTPKPTPASKSMLSQGILCYAILRLS
jgi:TATA-binding protein-associated factor